MFGNGHTKDATLVEYRTSAGSFSVDMKRTISYSHLCLGRDLHLMGAGRMPDPEISDNARTRCLWPEKHSWWYRSDFTLATGFRQNLRRRLVFAGIDG